MARDNKLAPKEQDLADYLALHGQKERTFFAAGTPAMLHLEMMVDVAGIPNVLYALAIIARDKDAKDRAALIEDCAKATR